MNRATRGGVTRGLAGNGWRGANGSWEAVTILALVDGTLVRSGAFNKDTSESSRAANRRGIIATFTTRAHTALQIGRGDELLTKRTLSHSALAVGACLFATQLGHVIAVEAATAARGH